MNLDDKELHKKLIDGLKSNLDFLNNNELLESPIENIVFERLFKYKNEDVELIAQKTVETISGKFRPDIVLKSGEKEIAIECDGEEFHQDEYYDEWRDSLILVSSNIESIFRLRGKDIYSDLENILFFISQKEPDYFNQDMMRRLTYSIGQEFKSGENQLSHGVMKRFMLEENDFNGEISKRMVVVTWRNLKKSFDRFCIREILISYLYPGKTVKDLIQLKEVKELSTERLYELFYEKYPEYKD